jgi:ATP-dependent Clp protease ATP-binding subunit ClpA
MMMKVMIRPSRARPLKRVIQQRLENPLANELLAEVCRRG